jgi:MFS family permease
MADDQFAPPSAAPALTSGEPSQPPPAPLAAPQRQPGALAPLRRRNFSLLFVGQLISALGDQAYGIALPWTVLTVTGDVRQMAIVLTAGAAARVLAMLIGGALADRLSPRLIMLVADFGRAGVVGALGAALFIELPPLWLVALLAGLEGIGSGLFTPGAAAITPTLVPEDELTAANGMMQVIQFLSLVFGPVLGGIATAAQASVAFLADGASFFVSGLSLAGMRVPRRARTAEKKSMAGDIGAGVRYAVSVPLLRTTMTVTIFGNFGFAGALGVGLVVLSRNLSASPLTLGIFFTAVGVGGIIGGISASLLARLKRRGLVSAALWVVVAALLGVIPLAAGSAASALPIELAVPADLRVPLVAVAMGLIGLVLALTDTVFITIMQQQIAADYMARVMSIQFLAGGITQPLALVAAGYAVVRFGPGGTFLAAGVTMLIASLIGLTSRALRRV